MQGGKGNQYEIDLFYEKLVADYARISLYDIEDMDCTEYLALRRDAVIHTLSKTEEGEKYLDNAWRLEQTEPERDRLRERFGKEAKSDG